jgi:sodium-dependent phosphate cotransporter
VKVLIVFACLYLFMVGIKCMSDAFKLMGEGSAMGIFKDSSPLVALFIGILATTLVQSSSITTSAVVPMAAAGVMPIETAFYMIMGANVGTTVTNTIVSLGHITQANEYRRAFAAATVHDFFNVIVLLILFPIEVFFHPLRWLSGACTGVFSGFGGAEFPNPFNVVINPVRGAVADLALGLSEFVSGNLFPVDQGPVLLVLGVLLLFSTLIGLVKSLKSLMLERLENLFDRLIFKTPYRALGFGLVFTVLVQSSSITTSLAVPLVGAGVLTIVQVVPYTMGANIGTTCTALLAALAVSGSGARADMIALQVAFFHVLFNVIGVCMMWRFRWLPIALATRFAALAVKKRLFPLVYIVVMFYIIPFLIVFS